MSPSPGRFAALRHRDYRLIWSGNFVSVIGTQMQFVAINWHVYKLLEGTTLTVDLLGRTVSLNSEALGLGGVGLARIIPIFFFALVGGTMADVVNRRKLLILTNGAAAASRPCWLCLSFAQRDTVWIVYLLTAAGAATSAFSSPAFQSIVPNLVPASDLTNAISLNSIVRTIATIIGPVVAGAILARTNIGWVYAINAVSFVAIVAALALIHYRAGPAAARHGTWSFCYSGGLALRARRAHYLGQHVAGLLCHVVQLGPHHAAAGGRSGAGHGRGGLWAAVQRRRDRLVDGRPAGVAAQGHLSPGRGDADQRGALRGGHRAFLAFPPASQ